MCLNILKWYEDTKQNKVDHWFITMPLYHFTMAWSAKFCKEKAVISSLSKLNTETKNFFYKNYSVWYAIWECHIKSER